MNEMNAFLGLLIASGATHQSKTNLKHLWSDSLYVPKIFSAVMSRDRMREIMRFLRFDDKETREERLVCDKIAAVREMYEMVVRQFKNSYNPSESLTIDERISPFKGRVGFKVYMPNKPSKYGIKLWMCCDAKNYYVTNFKIYSGKDGDKREKNQGENVVLDLTSHLKSGHNITTDNFFTSIRLAMKLLERKNPMTLLGTLRCNRKYIPESIRSHSKEDEYSSRFAFTDDLMIVSYIPKRNKSVVLLSSSHPNRSLIDDEKRKPEVILEYNATKFGVDKLDEMTKSTSCIRATRRWTVNIFYNILDMICYNSFISYQIAIDKNMNRRDYLFSLSNTLCRFHATKRLNIPSLHPSIKMNIRKLLPPNFAQEISPPSVKLRKNEKCDLCIGPNRKRKHADDYCVLCHQKVCRNHQQETRCINCV